MQEVRDISCYGSQAALPICTCAVRQARSATLTISYGYTAVTPTEAPKKKRTLLPLLTVLFLFSYGLMTMLIVEQGRAIQSQQDLIKTLMRDSSELWAAKGKAIADRQAAQAQAKNRAQAPAAQSQTPAEQAPATQAPKRHYQSRAGKTAKHGAELPPAPASDLVDRRRSLDSI